MAVIGSFLGFLFLSGFGITVNLFGDWFGLSKKNNDAASVVFGFVGALIILYCAI